MIMDDVVLDLVQRVASLSLRVKKLEEIVAISRSTTYPPDTRNYKAEVLEYERRLLHLRAATALEYNEGFRAGEEFSIRVMEGK